MVWIAVQTLVNFGFYLKLNEMATLLLEERLLLWP